MRKERNNMGINQLDIVLFAVGEEHQAASILSIAMVSNPIHIAVMGGQGEKERQRLEGWFLEMLRERPREVFVAKYKGEQVGVLRSQTCHGEEASQGQVTSESDVDESALVDPDSRMAHWLAVWDERDPQEPHRHLGPVGVHPQYQGGGIGSRLMERFCASVDENSEPAYLETDRVENVGFYEKFSFRTIGETDIFGVRNYFMWRPAQ
jgi:ribosomal protein S18 acetylase RimI-like enzyme